MPPGHFYENYSDKWKWQKLYFFQYGRDIGIAFQLVDDILDFVARSERVADNHIK
jgi:geranylgeranyl pyrophosphate synthase